MERRHISDTENRLVILYALRRLGPVTGAQLLQFMVELDLMNYFTMQLALSQMEEQGQLTQRAHPLGSLYVLTTAGAYTLDSFAHRIPTSRRQLIDERAESWRARFRGEQLAPADSFPLPDGTYCVRLRLLEENGSLMDIVLLLPAADTPTLVQNRWHTAAQPIYDAVMSALTQDYHEDVPVDDSPLPQPAGNGNWLLPLTDRPEHPDFTLMLTLPGKHLACYCAGRWPACHEALRTLILDELRRAPERPPRPL